MSCTPSSTVCSWWSAMIALQMLPFTDLMMAFSNSFAGNAPMAAAAKCMSSRCCSACLSSIGTIGLNLQCNIISNEPVISVPKHSHKQDITTLIQERAQHAELGGMQGGRGGAWEVWASNARDAVSCRVLQEEECQERVKARREAAQLGLNVDEHDADAPHSG
ncbi:hypothetical protein BKA93DRAFT_748291 [Sparassis latifolia]